MTNRVGVNVFDTINRDAASEIAFGAMVIRSADGTVTSAIDGSNTAGYDGIALDSQVTKTKDGFYATYDPIALATSGRVRCMVEGGGTDITSGHFLKIGNDFGMLIYEGGTKAVATSIAKATEDVEVSNYTSGTMSGTAATKAVTCADTTYFAAGDMVLLDNGGAVADSELNVIDSVDSTTTLTMKNAILYTYSAADIHKCVQVEVLLC
ncbi:MAG: hypothetical protein P9X24_04585 [Candidatus Hatepunaea meridiana]|nr:hypothetical protein [Candidatus Hatepunaea meridiana]